MDTHESPLCAALGHYIAQVTMIYCPHRGAYITICNVGDDADDVSWRSDRLDFGPFDGAAAVEVHAIAEVRRALRADLAAWEARRRPR